MSNLTSNLGDLFTIAAPISAGIYPAGVVTSSTIDRVRVGMPRSITVPMVTGNTSGAPASFTVTATVKSSSDGNNWAPLTDPAGQNIAQTISAANSDILLSASLLMAGRFVQIEYVFTFSEGTSPAVAFAAAHLLAGGNA